MTNVVQPERSSTAAELFEQTAHEDKIYFSHGFPLEKSRVIRKPEELNPVIFDENHVFGGLKRKDYLQQIPSSLSIEPRPCRPPLTHDDSYAQLDCLNN